MLATGRPFRVISADRSVQFPFNCSVIGAPSDLLVKLISLLLDIKENLPLTCPSVSAALRSPLQCGNVVEFNLTYGEEVSPIRCLPDEAFVDGKQFILKMEQLPTGGVGEDLSAGDGHDFALALAYIAPVRVGDAEVVASEGARHHAFLFHLQGDGLRLAELCEHTEWWIEQLKSHYCGGMTVVSVTATDADG